MQLRLVEEDAATITAELLKAITTEDVTQDKVCCLNTSLVFCELARRNGTLDEFLEVCARASAEPERRGGLQAGDRTLVLWPAMALT